ATGPGPGAVVSRLTDALLAQALRQCLLEADRVAGGRSVVTDPQIARALRLIRERPDHPWSVPELAATVGMSRSAFAERFRGATGETPIQSLTRYRLERAAEYLRTTNARVRGAAGTTGYHSGAPTANALPPPSRTP